MSLCGALYLGVVIFLVGGWVNERLAQWFFRGPRS
jgi:hypothetical protein